MLSSSSVKNHLENLHLRYLCENFDLERCPVQQYQNRVIQPDLINCDAIFELKTRMYPQVQNGARKRPISDFAWWKLNMAQIQDYEGYTQNTDLIFFWILLIGQAKNASTEMKTVSERLILQRDIYVLPWDAHNLVEVAPSGDKHLGLSRVKRNFEFSIIDILKGCLYLENTIKPLLEDIF